VAPVEGASPSPFEALAETPSVSSPETGVEAPVTAADASAASVCAVVPSAEAVEVLFLLERFSLLDFDDFDLPAG
jgi:hypothetical protein